MVAWSQPHYLLLAAFLLFLLKYNLLISASIRWYQLRSGLLRGSLQNRIAKIVCSILTFSKSPQSARNVVLVRYTSIILFHLPSHPPNAFCTLYFPIQSVRTFLNQNIIGTLVNGTLCGASHQLLIGITT